MAYVYRHIRLDKNEVFYIGIGTDNNYSRAKTKDRRNKHWKNIVAKTDYITEILCDDLDVNIAKEKEKEFIALYGRCDLGLGTLVNLTDGGDGAVNIKRSEETRRKLSENGKRLPREALLKMINAGIAKARNMSEETRMKLSISHKGKSQSEEARRKIGNATRGKKRSEETKRKMSEAQRGEKSHLYGKNGLLNKTCKGYVLVHKGNEFIGKYEGIYDCARKMNLNPSNINRTILSSGIYKGYSFKRIAAQSMRNAYYKCFKEVE